MYSKNKGFPHELFLVSDLRDSLTLLIKKKGMRETKVFFLTYKKHTKIVPKNTILVKIWCESLVFSEQKSKCAILSKKGDLIIRSFIMSNLSELLTVTLLTRAT